MADKIRVHTGRLGSDADGIQNCINRLTKQMDDLRISMDALEHMWEGSGSQAFHKACREDIQAMESVLADLKSVYEYDVNAKKEYETCEKKIASLIADLKV